MKLRLPKALLAIASLPALIGLTATKSEALDLVFQGQCYRVSSTNTTFTNFDEATSQPWWGPFEASRSFAEAAQLENALRQRVLFAYEQEGILAYGFLSDTRGVSDTGRGINDVGLLGVTGECRDEPPALPDEIVGNGNIDVGIPIAIAPTTDNIIRLALNILPRNPIATGGKSLQEYQNDLADTIFERAPLRRFSFANNSTIADDTTITAAGVELQEIHSLPAQYLEQEGLSAWVKSFGGDTSAFQYVDSAYGEFGNWKSSHSGITTGVDYAFSDNFKIGGFGNWGSVSVTYLGLAGGNWNPQGWGGGLTANYTEENFYAQALLSATSFSGTHNRYLLSIGNFEGRTATATKTTTSYLGALRIGSPQQWGKAVIEPQLTGSWVHNEDHAWEETGGGVFNLRYRDYSDNFLQTLAAIKLSLPIHSGERALFNPFVRIGWIADWDLNNADAKVTNVFANRSANIPIVQDDEHGLLLEGGLDYTINNLGSTSFKLYAKGGIELWDNDQKDTDWRVSGGVTFTFGGAPKGSPKAEVVDEVIIEPAPEAAPVRGLW